VAELFKGFGCQVCQAPASGIHFGAVTCEGCKVTTKRTIIISTHHMWKIENENMDLFDLFWRAFFAAALKKERPNVTNAPIIVTAK
jgi:hypothetical protein